MKHYLLFAGGAMFCLAACDPARRIDFRNHSRDTAEVVWKVKEDSIGFNPFNISNSRTLKLTIPPHKKTKIKMSFGDGTWSPEEVERLISGVESLQISTASQVQKIDSLPLLKEYLLARRKGIGGSRIEIIIEK
jgi:hypothetical protein